MSVPAPSSGPSTFPCWFVGAVVHPSKQNRLEHHRGRRDARLQPLQIGRASFQHLGDHGIATDQGFRSPVLLRLLVHQPLELALIRLPFQALALSHEGGLPLTRLV